MLNRSTTRSISIQRHTARRMPAKALQARAAQISRLAVGKTMSGKGWRAYKPRLCERKVDDGWNYTICYRFKKESSRSIRGEAADRQWAKILQNLCSAARTRGWIEKTERTRTSASTSTWAFGGNGTGELTVETIADWQTHFSKFINLNDQVSLLLDALKAAIESNFEDRCHTAVHGPPGCGKTEVLRTLCNLLGPRHSQFFDATAMTKAGAEEFLLTTARIPSVIVLDELDKAPAETGKAWLQVASDHAEVNKTDARRGSRRRETRTLVIAAANDLQSMEKRLGEALCSRLLAHRIFFPQPARDDVIQILKSVASNSTIDEAAVLKVMQHVEANEPDADLRRTIGLLKAGRNGWVSGDFAERLQRVNDQETGYRDLR
jgi:hypothetical protein